MKCYRAIIFDFDMTLADSSKVIMDLLNDCARHFGYPGKSYEETLPIVGNTHEIMLSHVSGESAPEKLLEMRDYYRALCRAEMPRRTALFPGAVECLAEINRKGILLGLLSLKLRDVLLASLEKYRIDKFFGVVIGCEEAPAPKPDPSGLFAAIHALGVSADETLYVGDSLVDEGAAHSAGIDFAAMLLGGTAREQFRKNRVCQFYRSLDQLRSDIAGL